MFVPYQNSQFLEIFCQVMFLYELDISCHCNCSLGEINVDNNRNHKEERSWQISTSTQSLCFLDIEKDTQYFTL